MTIELYNKLKSENPDGKSISYFVSDNKEYMRAIFIDFINDEECLLIIEKIEKMNDFVCWLDSEEGQLKIQSLFKNRFKK